MKFTPIRLASLLGLCLALALSNNASATSINFAVDPAGTATGLTEINNSTANTGKYAAGSWLTLSGSISGTTSGVSFTGNFAAQKAASGTFPTGSPGSLVSFYTGSLLADVDYYNNTIKLTGGSLLNASQFNGHWPAVAGAAIPVSPQIGGGPSTAAPGSDPGDYGVSLNIGALGGLIPVAKGTGALRDVFVDLQQHPPATQELLIGTLASQTFATANQLEIGIVSGNLDYNLKGQVVFGSTVPDLIGTTEIAGDPPTFTVTTGGTATLNTTLIPNGKHIGEQGALANVMITVPIKATSTQSITGDTPVTVTITLTGQMAAYATNVDVPEPGTIALASIAGLALIPVGYRRFRSRSSKATK